MKRVIALLSALILAISLAFTASAEDGTVTYSGNAGEFIFSPGGKESPTDIFPEFKGIMPGDTVTQRITVKNNADKEVKVKIYLRSLGATLQSANFLSWFELKVKKSEDNEMAYMFDAAISETAQLSDWVCLGTLYSGGEVNLELILSAPVELPNFYQDNVGYFNWEFMVEEFPVEPTDPDTPQTNDNMGIWALVMAGSLGAFVILLLWRRKKKKD